MSASASASPTVWIVENDGSGDRHAFATREAALEFAFDPEGGFATSVEWTQDDFGWLSHHDPAWKPRPNERVGTIDRLVVE